MFLRSFYRVRVVYFTYYYPSPSHMRIRSCFAWKKAQHIAKSAYFDKIFYLTPLISKITERK